ncbi:hypothetical protein [Terrabacter sp. Ter38]|uniref:hypothetical protein n=1 Tax=Terrabacter sp. Ter38 TaxID=2926030 RepID=UPI0021177424|nr:hypothetical protein [Terrabacter sp. Ter38]
MSRDPQPIARPARALVLSGTAAMSSTMAHAAAGGHTPTGPSLVLTVVLLTLLALPVAHRAKTVPSAAVVLAGLQVITHAANVVASWTRTAPAAPLRQLGASQGHHQVRHASRGASEKAAGFVSGPGAGVTAGGGMGDVSSPGMDSSLAALVPSVGMLLAHLGVATLLAWAFTSTERSWQVTRRLLDLVLTGPLAYLRRHLTRGVAVFGGASAVRAATSARTVMAMPSPRLARDVWAGVCPARRGPPLTLLR